MKRCQLISIDEKGCWELVVFIGHCFTAMTFFKHTILEAVAVECLFGARAIDRSNPRWACHGGMPEQASKSFYSAMKSIAPLVRASTLLGMAWR